MLNQQYTYAPLGANQLAGPLLWPTLGSKSPNKYPYDQQYRLTTSYGKGDFIYNFSAGYSPAGRLGNKLTGIYNRKPMDLLFGYDPKCMTHQPRTMFDWGSGRKMEFFRDANGNLAQAILDDAVLYPNPYMVVTHKGYTKHYYAGTERLATVIGG